MKKTRFIMLSAIALAISSTQLQANDILLEARGAYYGPTNSLFREIYSGSGRYGLEVSAQAWKGLYPFVSVDYFYKSGHSIGGCNNTNITLVPIGVGLKYLFPFQEKFDFYVGAGVVPTYMRIRDQGPFVEPTTHKWGVGGVAKTGFLYTFTNGVFLDLFGDYTYTKINIDQDDCCVERNNADVSGWAVGLGIGYRFR